MSQDWLDIGGENAAVVTSAKMTGETKRMKAMTKRLLGKSRTWMCDGDYVLIRRKQANPETLKRHEEFIAKNEYAYVATYDDIEVYKLQETSPFRRKEPVDLTELDDYNLRRTIARAACRRDWVTYVDALEEIAGRIKGRYDPGFGRNVFLDVLADIELMIERRGGPGQAERDREVNAVRKKHGLGRDRAIYLPT